MATVDHRPRHTMIHKAPAVVVDAKAVAESSVWVVVVELAGKEVAACVAMAARVAEWMMPALIVVQSVTKIHVSMAMQPEELSDLVAGVQKGGECLDLVRPPLAVLPKLR